MNKAILRSASVLLAVVLAFGAIVPGQATSQNAVLMPNEIVNLAFFYKPPSNSTAANVASTFNNVILTGGDETFRTSLASNGFSSTIPQYLRAEGIQDPGNCTSSPSNNQIANRPGDFCSISQNHPDWFLLDTNGNRLRTSPTSNYYRMDPGNAGWRTFFVTRLLETQQQKGWSGLFLDNVEASLSEIQGDGLASAKYPDHASYQSAVRGFLQYLYQNYAQPYGRPLLGNIIARQDDATWYSYLQYMDGAMQERWSVAWSFTDYVSESKWKSDMILAEQTQSQGKYIILVAPGDKANANRQNFAFASYLLISNGKASFRYADDDLYTEVWLYNNYSVDLGVPTGPRYQTGTAWRRNFTKGYVIVDPVNRTATISASPDVSASPSVTFTPSAQPSAAATNTSTRAPTLAVTSTSTRAATLAATNTPTKTPTLVPVSTATTAPTLPVYTPTQAVVNTPTTVPPTSPPVSLTTIYNDKDPVLQYSRHWSDVADGQAYMGSFRLTQKVGSSVTLNFTGQTFSIIYKTGPVFGNMEVYVDGTLVHTLNQNTASPLFQQKWSYPGTLSPGSHTLKLVFASPTSGRVSLDAVSIP
jgi:hypothetical protein